MTLLTVSIGTFMLLLHVTIVHVALPEIERDLGASLTDLQWVFDSYVLSLAALTLMAGFAGRPAGPEAGRRHDP